MGDVKLSYNVGRMPKFGVFFGIIFEKFLFKKFPFFLFLCHFILASFFFLVVSNALFTG